jgi:hypothetical protein
LEGRETEQLLEITANDCRQRSTANGLANRIVAPNPLPRADESGADELMLANSCCAEQEAAHSRLLHDVNSIAIKAWFLFNRIQPSFFWFYHKLTNLTKVENFLKQKC